MKSNRKILGLLLLSLCCFSSPSWGKIKLPRLISDGMVLQRDADVKIWGWASRNESVTIRFLDSAYHTTADSSGTWAIQLAKLSAGGPYSMTLMASDTMSVQDILVGTAPQINVHFGC
jgi:sialate O-acetylesterase